MSTDLRLLRGFGTTNAQKNKIRILQNAVPGGPIVLAPFMSCSPTELITKGMPNQGMGIHMSNPVLSIVSNATISPPHLHHI